MAVFNGNLNQNKILFSSVNGALYNMIISQQFSSNNIKGTNGGLVDRFKTDGTLYGDTKLFYDTDILRSDDWTNYSEAGNLLAVKKPDAPKCQPVTLDAARIVWVTLDNYLTKQGFTDEGTFSQFKSVIMQAMQDTKRVYESTLMNVFVGTQESAVGSQTQTVAEVQDSGDAEADARMKAQRIAQKLADILVDVKDPSRMYNDYGFMRSYDDGDFVAVWNADYVNEITKLDLPTIFHKDGLMEKFSEVSLPPKYFGKATTGTNTITSQNYGTYRALGEGDYEGTAGTVHLFAGEPLPLGASATVSNSYTVDGTIICKLIHKDAIPFMSGFEVATNFFNPRSLTDTKFLVWAYSTPVRLQGKPFITVKYGA